jgi:Domain of unknown function (DUF4340)
MSVKLLLRLGAVLVALLLLWGAAALARRHQSAAPGERFALGPFGRTAVDTVRILRGADTTLLARRDSTTWRVNGHPASRTAVGELLDALSDSTRRSEVVAERPSSHAGLGVDSSGSRVRIVGRDSVLADLVVGQRTTDLEGGYLRLANDSVVHKVSGRLSEVLTRSADDWRDRRIGGVARDSVARVEVTRRGRAYGLRRGEKGWSFMSGGAADSAAVASLLSAYAAVEAQGFATPRQADSARFQPADRKARLLRADGTPLLALVFDSTAGGFWLRADHDSTVYRMDSWTADRLTPADSTLKPKRR